MSTRTNTHPADIVALIKKSDATVTQVATQAGLHPSGLSQCLRRPIPAANRAIAAHLGLALHELWPEWFDEDGEPKPRKRKPNTGEASSQRKNRSAA